MTARYKVSLDGYNYYGIHVPPQHKVAYIPFDIIDTEECEKYSTTQHTIMTIWDYHSMLTFISQVSIL